MFLEDLPRFHKCQERPHSGSPSDYDNLVMGDKEEIEDFQARFLTLINSLSYLGEQVTNWKQVNKVLQSLNSSWNPIAINFQTQPHTKDLDIDEFFEKLCAFNGLQKRKEAPKLAKEAKDKNLTLKVEKALRLMHDEGGLSEEDSKDEDMALITKGIKRF